MKTMLIPTQRHCTATEPVFSEALGQYVVQRLSSARVEQIVAFATELLRSTIAKGPMIGSPSAIKDYLRMKLAGATQEIFGAIYLDSQNVVLADEELAIGTLTQTSVYPREVVRSALRHNAAAIIIYHNHPSDNTTPSRADELLTQTLKSSLNLVDVRVLDHIVVGTTSACSFAERGLL